MRKNLFKVVFMLFILTLVGCSDTNNNVNNNTNNDVDVIMGEDLDEDVDLSQYSIKLDKEFEFTKEEIDNIDEVIKDLVKKDSSLKDLTYVKGKEIDQISDDDYALIFTYKLCGPCRVYKAELFNYINAEGSYPVYLVDIELLENKSYIESFSISATPTTLIFKNGSIKAFMEGSMGFADLDSLFRGD